MTLLRGDEGLWQSLHFGKVSKLSSLGAHFTGRALTLQTIAKSILLVRGKEHPTPILLDPDRSVTKLGSLSDSFPLWKDVTDLYSGTPIIPGLDLCKRYQQNLEDQKILRNRHCGMKVAGTFNLGSNAMVLTLKKHLVNQKYYLHDTTISIIRF